MDNYTPETPTSKVCTKCGIDKPLECYSKQKAGKYGRTARCKDCRNKYRREILRKRPHVKAQEREYHERTRARRNELARKRYAENPDHFRKKRKRYYHENRELELERYRKWREENPEKSRQSVQSWFDRNPDYKREYAKRYRKQNREYLNEYRRQWAREHPLRERAKWARRWAQRKNAKGIHTGDDIRAMLTAQEYTCGYCDCDISDEYHIDHIRPLSRGGRNDPPNLLATCPSCNMSKGDKTLEEWGLVITDKTILSNIDVVLEQWIDDHADDNGNLRLFD